MQDENHKNAIVRFKEAVRLEPDSLDIRSNLAEAYLKAGMIDASEKEYREILDISPYHMDSLIGIGQTYIMMGEDANTRKDSGNAELMFATADNYYCETIRLMQQPESASKILNCDERSSVFYSKGYNEVMLYEIQSRQDIKRLKRAIEDFRKVEKWTPNYYKAQRAITKISERINPPQGILHKVGPMLILVFSLVVFILAQLLFTFGKPVLGF
jgi:tetratricopeptide (TPR) repeat protein